jgi:hypothetical protein
MKETGWSYICSSVIGSKHTQSGLPCQDASDCKLVKLTDDTEVLIAIASDGAGSAQYALAGSATACTSFISRVRASLDEWNHLSFLTASYIKEWVASFQSEIKTIAEQNDASARDYACTFVAAVIGKEQGVFAQIGDGGIVVLKSGSTDTYQTVFWPQEGEYANQTNFLTDNKAEENLMFEVFEGSTQEVAIFTDGMQSLVLNEESKTAHSPFFRPIFAALRKAEGGCAVVLQNSMVDYLLSQRVTERTDDDKTLIFATRFKDQTDELIDNTNGA